MKKLALVLLVFLLVSPMLQAQTCFRGKPLPECKMFFITEACGIMSVIGDYQRFGVNYEFGGMYNLNKRSALGATFFLALGYYSGAGFKARYRHWLNSSFSVDISPGLLLWGERKNPTFTGHVGLNYKDWVVLITQIDIRRYTWRPNKVDLSLGVKFGSYAGSALTVASAIGLVILIIAIPPWD